MNDKDIEIRQDQRAIAMKSGLIHWVTVPTAERLQEQLRTQGAHTFVKIAELSITINTSEIEGIYGIEEYAKIAKLKQGMWECEYKRWHERKHQCTCASDIARKQWEDERKKIYQRNPRTAEEQKSMNELLANTRKELERKGVL